VTELHERLDRSRAGLERGARRSLERARQRIDQLHQHLRRAPALMVERKRARLEHAAGRLRALSPRSTLERGYAIVRVDAGIVRTVEAVTPGDELEIEVADGRFGARAE
jgi:exodeoxyribonuclease VII large subunit